MTISVYQSPLSTQAKNISAPLTSKKIQPQKLSSHGQTIILSSKRKSFFDAMSDLQSVAQEKMYWGAATQEKNSQFFVRHAHTFSTLNRGKIEKQTLHPKKVNSAEVKFAHHNLPGSFAMLNENALILKPKINQVEREIFKKFSKIADSKSPSTRTLVRVQATPLELKTLQSLKSSASVIRPSKKNFFSRVLKLNTKNKN